MHLHFSWIGLIVFLLPLPFTLLYMLFPPNDSPASAAPPPKLVTLLEQSSRILLAASLCLFTDKHNPDFGHYFFYCALIFFLMYNLVWLRYFVQGRQIFLLSKPFLKLPLPLAILPVFYFLFASLWLKNYIAFGFALLFGVMHCLLSYLAFYNKP